MNLATLFSYWRRRRRSGRRRHRSTPQDRAVGIKRLVKKLSHRLTTRIATRVSRPAAMRSRTRCEPRPRQRSGPIAAAPPWRRAGCPLVRCRCPRCPLRAAPVRPSPGSAGSGTGGHPCLPGTTGDGPLLRVGVPPGVCYGAARRRVGVAVVQPPPTGGWR